MKTIDSVGVALCALVLSVAALPAGASARVGFELRPGVVSDGDTTLYVMQPEGGLAAVDVTTGRELWSTGSAARPLYADDDILVAQVETPGRYGMLNLAVFDVRAPAAAPASVAIEMPSGTQALVVDGRKASFDVWATRSGNVALVGWTYTRNEKTAVETASRNAAARQTSSGAVRVPLGRGAVRTVDVSEAPHPKRALPAAVFPTLDGFDAKLTIDAVDGGVRPAGNTLALVELPSRDPRQSATVRRWNAASGAAMGAVEVFGDGHLIKNRSSDGRYLLGSRRAGGSTAAANYAWTLVDLATGQPVTSFERTDAAASFFVTADHVVVDAAPRGRRVGDTWVWQPLTVQGLDRKSGAVRWTRPVRDTAYSGDLPPAP